MANDLVGFDMTLLHFRRTFVEKLFALHGKVVRLITEDHPIGRHARHYSDLYVLSDQSEVRAMLASDEYEEIRRDYDVTSRNSKYLARIYRPPEDLSFAESPALFPDGRIKDQLRRDYDEQCRMLFSGGDYPPFDQVLRRFEELRRLL